MIEKYSKQEIVNAIKIKSRFDAALEPALEMIIKREKLNRAYAEWKTANSASLAALNAFADYQSALIKKYGKMKLTELSERERDEYIRLATISRKADEKQEYMYKKYKELEP